MTLREYQLRLEAYQVRQVKKQENLATLAWFIQSVQATKGDKHPKPVYREFKDFFDTQKQIDQVRAEFEPDYKAHSQASRTIDRGRILARRVEEFKKLKAAGKIIPWEERRMTNGGL
jgi:hypothetical protein